jgi:hypothetical protein
MQQKSIAKQLHCHDILMLMNIGIICKLGKNNVEHDILSRKEEYQGDMPWGTTQILHTMFVVKNGR